MSEPTQRNKCYLLLLTNHLTVINYMIDMNTRVWICIRAHTHNHIENKYLMHLKHWSTPYCLCSGPAFVILVLCLPPLILSLYCYSPLFLSTVNTHMGKFSSSLIFSAVGSTCLGTCIGAGLSNQGWSKLGASASYSRVTSSHTFFVLMTLAIISAKMLHRKILCPLKVPEIYLPPIILEMIFHLL